MKIKIFFSIIFFIVLPFIFSAKAQKATTPLLDPIFGQSGKVFINTSNDFQLSDMALQADGKIVATGQGGYNSN